MTETKKNDVTELVFILDRSGSMQGLEADTVGGFNGMLAKQKESGEPCFVSTVLFDDVTEVLHDRLPLESVQPITTKEYYVRGCTALLDALGGAIRHVENIHKYARKEDVPAHTMFVVITDGLENASRRYTAEEVRRTVRAKQAECGWEFIFIGANIDAVETAKNIGVSPERAVNYHADAKGTHTVFGGVSRAVSCLRHNAPMAEGEWRREMDEDFESRK